MAQEPWTEFIILLTVCSTQVMVPSYNFNQPPLICCSILKSVTLLKSLQPDVFTDAPLPICYLVSGFLCAAALSLHLLIEHSDIISSSTDSVLSHQTFPKSNFPIFYHTATAILSFPFCVFIIQAAKPKQCLLFIMQWYVALSKSCFMLCRYMVQLDNSGQIFRSFVWF